MKGAANATGFTPSSLFLMGIPGLEHFHAWFSAPVCIIYVTTLLGNIILLISINMGQTLHKPMYLLISMLAFCDMALSSSVVPKMLSIFWFNAEEIQFWACLLQMFFSIYFLLLDSSIISIMGFDRYVAVCHPLRYAGAVTNSLVVKLVVGCSIRVGVLLAPVPLSAMSLPYCARRVANSYCENMSVVKLSCGDISFNRQYLWVLWTFINQVDICCIALSYTMILRAILQLPFEKDRIKAFRTCSSHLCILIAFYVPLLLVVLLHRVPHGIPHYIHIILGDCMFMLSPLLNPLIYGLMMKDVRQCVGKTFHKMQNMLRF